MKPGRFLVLVLFGIGAFALQFGAIVLGIADPKWGALHLFRTIVLTPLNLLPSHLAALLSTVPHEGAPNSGLYTLLSLLLLNTLIWTIFFNLFLTAVPRGRHSTQ